MLFGKCRETYGLCHSGISSVETTEAGGFDDKPLRGSGLLLVEPILHML